MILYGAMVKVDIERKFVTCMKLVTCNKHDPTCKFRENGLCNIPNVPESVTSRDCVSPQEMRSRYPDASVILNQYGILK